MTHTRMFLGLSLVGALALTACGGTTAADPLTGTWSNTSCYGTSSTPVSIASCSVVVSFSADLNVDLTVAWVSMPATATYPGCTTTKRVTGQQWSTDSALPTSTMTVTGAGAATVERTGCVNATDNMDATATSDISITSGDTEYQISGTTLTIMSGSVAGTYLQ